jgi:hypothetical protein
VIDRERVIRIASGGPLRVQADELDELCRAYLAWLDAPEGSAESHCDARADWIEVEVSDEQATHINGKRVRLVEVK